MPNRPAVRTIQGHKHGRVPRALREEQLLDVAEALFTRLGYQGASIDGIAETAGISRPIVYNYFKSKDGIYLACMRRARRQLDEEIARAFAGAKEPRERIAAATEAYYRFVENRGGAWELLYGGGVAVAGPAAAETRALRFHTIKIIANQLREILGPKPSDRDIDAYANLISGGGEQLAKWWRHTQPSIPRREIVRRQVAMFWSGLEQLRG